MEGKRQETAPYSVVLVYSLLEYYPTVADNSLGRPTKSKINYVSAKVNVTVVIAC